jgi:hypothetical protein
MANIRETVLGWNPFIEPTQLEYDVAVSWMQASNNNPRVGASDLAKIKELIRRYEYNHPEIFPRG